MLAQRAARHPQVTRVLISLLLAILVAGILSGWQALLRAEQHQSKARLQLETDAIAQQLQTRFELQAQALQRLGKRWPSHYDKALAWQQDVQALLDGFDNFQAIEWLDSQYRMRWIEPLAGNEEAVDFVYTAAHPNYPILLQARDTQTPLLSNSFELLQGGRGLAYYIPLYRRANDPTSFDGLLLGIFRVEVLLGTLLREERNYQLSIDFHEQDQLLFSHKTADTLDQGWTVSSPVQLGRNTGFYITAMPTSSLLASSTTHLPLLILISGLLAAVSLCYALWLALLSAQRLEALGASNRKLQQEIVRRQSTEESLQRNQAQLKLVLDMTNYSHDALFIIGMNPQELVYLNRTCWKSLGYSEEELRQIIAIAPADIMPDVLAWSSELRELAERGGNSIYQQHVTTRHGKSIPLEISVQHLNRYGRAYLICVGRNNSEQLEVAARLQELSQQDGLTGLYNRRYFDEALNREWRRLRRQSGPLGLLMLDVDHFKAFNDSLGHQAGDDALKQLANAMRGTLLREGEAVCRYGGEEFAIILPGADIAQCAEVARHLHAAVKELKIPHPSSQQQWLTVSIGAASLPATEQDRPESLISLADKALYTAKATGRNRSVMSSDDEWPD
ncbi:diguanylate cyclase [Halopseudomonas pelagia]|uniref:diguanylate cyclase n=1 Tax=Halopseudomonas pelagia TaxID=553151 RepID=UPI0003A31FC9|nr:diguanylate cyclase [Halopseudomonas pelagia]